MFCTQLGEAVVGDAGKFRRLLRAGHRLERRQPEREDLRVVVELIHHLEARLEIIDGANALDAFADVLRTAGGARHLLEQAWREEMAEGVDMAHGSSFFRYRASAKPARQRGPGRWPRER
jgi:hypothetical protein